MPQSNGKSRATVAGNLNRNLSAVDELDEKLSQSRAKSTFEKQKQWYQSKILEKLGKKNEKIKLIYFCHTGLQLIPNVLLL